MALTLGMITFDTLDPGPLAKWWAKQTAGTIEQENDGWFYVVALPGSAQKLAFQKVDDPTPGKNRIHLDLSSDDLDGEVGRLSSDGATEVARHEMGGFRWVTLADPDGNQFCVSGPHA
ncbi:VOC family protein [Rhodococcus sp. NPDC056960]|jgi:predicted enzyme related to lactoylglutathione lyase|uniref:VOC family protein n=1 Tax=unclassified Rhodococcus (in: high G+C Gram-positive bacteria) TaxID=192944 RepID=UPI00163AB559|nr:MULTISPECIES: VOC family protein [unclassified Rhodococcus (in: high G+C Gram-positive bacteria)]MBC2639873.1 VOC family protein [Rhodococcus sp. 3A]MBC2895381.1 VOC family protein [Rhodococcus sp. 4CII]